MYVSMGTDKGDEANASTLIWGEIKTEKLEGNISDINMKN
jgi:hypothetical protein